MQAAHTLRKLGVCVDVHYKYNFTLEMGTLDTIFDHINIKKNLKSISKPLKLSFKLKYYEALINPLQTSIVYLYGLKTSKRL